MIKTLIAKELSQMAALFLNRGRSKSRVMPVVMGLLMVYLYGVFCMMFGFMCYTLCPPLKEAGLGWLYFALAGLLAVMLSVFGSVFAAKSSLYEASDNEMLLAMPIPVWILLLSRTVVLYISNLIFSSVVLLPAYVIWWVNGGLSPATVLACLILLLLLPLAGLVLSCLFGWLLALLGSKIRSKSLLTVLGSLIFIGVYMAVMTQMEGLLASLIANSGEIAGWMRGWGWLFAKMGEGASGSLPALLLFAALILAIAAGTYAFLSRSFLGIALNGHKSARARAKSGREDLRASSRTAALFGRELRHFLSSSGYMLNSGIASILLIIAAVAAIFQRDKLAILAEIPGVTGFLPLIVLGGVCLVAGMNTVTASAVSLEGVNLWQIRSLPIPAKDILRAKLYLHLFITHPAAWVGTLGLGIALGLGAAEILLLLVIVSAYVLLSACTGLLINLRFPNFHWVSETACVKQGMSVMLSMLAGWLGAALLTGLGALLVTLTGTLPGLALTAVLSGAGGFGMLYLIDHRGAAMFDRL
ncbi:MAG: hypothetical protein IJ493_07025 [Clostridia bacterium]|nr:hypothetical protein [Clostridia bacterium]